MANRGLELANLTWQGKLLAALVAAATLAGGVGLVQWKPGVVVLLPFTPLLGLGLFLGGWGSLALFGVPVFKPRDQQVTVDRNISWRRVFLLVLILPLAALFFFWMVWLLDQWKVFG